MRFLKVQVLLLVLAVLAVGALAFDVVLKNRAEAELAAEVADRVPETTGVQARISSFPFVGRLLLSNKVPKVVVTAQHTSVEQVSLNDIRVEVEDVEMDSDEAMDGRAVVRSIGRGSVKAELRQDQINSRLPRGFQVQIQQGRATVSGPNAVQAQLVNSPEGRVQLLVARRSVFELPFPKTELLPCNPTGTFISGAVRLDCAFDEIPALLLQRAQR